MSKRRLTPKARAAISRLGQDIEIARKKRRISQRDFAAKTGVSLSTMQRLEGGDPGISIGILAMAFVALGNLRRFTEVLDVASDGIGLIRDQSELPKRIRKKTTGKSDLTGLPSDDKIEGMGL